MRLLSKSDPNLRRLLDRESSGLASPVELAELDTEREAIVARVRSATDTSVGQSWAYERCPAYRAIVEAGIRKRKSEARQVNDEEDLFS